MGKQVLSIIIAFLGNSMLNIGQAVQKVGLDSESEKKLKKWGLWTIGTISITLATLVIRYAVSLGGASLVGAMAGSGLASLTLFSIFVMKEKVGRNEIIGVVIILAASGIIGYFSQGESIQSEILIGRLFLYLGIIVAIYIIIILIFIKKEGMGGILIGGFAGALGGFVPLFQKVETIQSTGGGIEAVLSNPYLYAWVGVSIVSFLVLQFAYKRDKAIRIIPFFAGNFIIVPVIGGVLCFKEILNTFQWAGVILIFVGVLFITIKKKKSEITPDN